MRRTAITLASAVLATMFAASVQAQATSDLGKGPGGSAHVKTEWKFAEANISIAYGRPALKGRSESQMMPIGKPWRTGADQATVLTTDTPLVFGSVRLEPGSYTINTQPGEKSWELIFGKLEKAGQWGVPYLPALEIGRAPMRLSKLVVPVEEVTFHIDRRGAQQALRVDWGTLSASAPFSIRK
jgi:hypothetical protein